VRADARCFAVVPGHESAADGVVAAWDHLVIVEKLGAARALAERTDPRRKGERN